MSFVLAIFAGKLVQFIVCSLLYMWFGIALVHSAKHLLHRHLELVIAVSVAALLVLVFYMIRKIFDRRKGVHLPVEQNELSVEESS